MPQHPQVSRALSQAYDNVELAAKEVDATKSAKEAMEALKQTLHELHFPPEQPVAEEGSMQGAPREGWLARQLPQGA